MLRSALASLILLLTVGVQSAAAQGSIIGWGGLVVVGPESLQDVVAVAAGVNHSLGVKADGSIVAWGGNDYGQCDVPAPNTGFVAVAAGYWHGLGLKAVGEHGQKQEIGGEREKEHPKRTSGAPQRQGERAQNDRTIKNCDNAVRNADDMRVDEAKECRVAGRSDDKRQGQARGLRV